MPLKTIKPDISNFIEGAKAENLKPEPPERLEEMDDEELFRTDKTFLLRLPPKLWERAKQKAKEEKLSLHNYILLAIKEKSMQNPAK